MRQTNYYQLLSVRRDASAAEIRHAYVERIKHAHPDLIGTDWRPVASVEALQRAYRCLLDPAARREHDIALDLDNAAHVERLHRAQRRLWYRARSHGNARLQGMSTRHSSWRSTLWRLVLLAVIATAVSAKLGYSSWPF